MDPVSICNLALGWVGAKPIASFEDESVQAELCAPNYAPVVRAALEQRAWTFATQRLDLGAAQDSGVVEYPKRFVLPSTVVRVLACDDGSGTFAAEWVREGQSVLTVDASTFTAKAIVLIEDPALWSPSFVDVVVYRLASLLAMPLTQNRALAGDMFALYEAALRRAGTLDGMQGVATPPRKASPIASRRF